eukprot:CAMPEP_0204421682 /NCGR_PEP_ID=MMETSP0470-20130426/35049_1 /ASSEMBLY_ACC=CAM_ASM_000385 /TAXON_ID=2969 /ORGANISM="Oxyrrhis marina" /LENGTH=123 /DNA_ID=CAMNT_0051418835 /DNA_START=63 /DNA_END=435 /DNA_ORIENTATION=-
MPPSHEIEAADWASPPDVQPILHALLVEDMLTRRNAMGLSGSSATAIQQIAHDMSSGISLGSTGTSYLSNDSTVPSGAPRPSADKYDNHPRRNEYMNKNTSTNGRRRSTNVNQKYNITNARTV